MTLSKKLQDHIENPRFFNPQLEAASLPSLGFKWGKHDFWLKLNGELDENGLLQKIEFSSNLTGIGLGILDGLLELMNEKEFFFCALVYERELENYLRDQNHQAAFSVQDLGENESIAALLRIVQKSLSTLIAKNLFTKLNSDLSFAKLATFPKSDLITRMGMLEEVRKHILMALIAPFAMEIRFSELWQNDLYYQFTLPTHRDHPTLRNFLVSLFQESFRLHSGLQQLNWVAEPV